MADKPDRNITRFSSRMYFFIAILLIVVLAGLYFLLGLGISGDSDSPLLILKSLCMDVIANLVPVFLIFAISYLAIRDFNLWITELEKSELVSRIVSEVKKIFEPTINSSSQHDLVMVELCKGMQTIYKKLFKNGFRPDIVITFNRSGTALAGMISVNMKLYNIITISRVPINKIDASTDNKQQYIVGEFIQLNSRRLAGKKILILFMLMETGDTIEDGLKFIRSQGVNQEIEVATMYITPGIRTRWPKAIFAYETTDPKGVLKRLPWVDDDYDFL